MVIERVTDVQDPVFSDLDGVGRVAPRVAGQWNQEDPGSHVVEACHAGESVPDLGTGCMFDDGCFLAH